MLSATRRVLRSANASDGVRSSCSGYKTLVQTSMTGTKGDVAVVQLNDGKMNA